MLAGGGNKDGTRSTYHEPMHLLQQQPFLVPPKLKSQHSAQTTGSAKIGMLMKGLEGGSMFMRSALKKMQ
jgi:hypothetical protein